MTPMANKIKTSLALLALINLAESALYLGCYRDYNRPPYALLGGDSKEFPGTNSPQTCWKYCDSKEFDIYGVEGEKCFCGSYKPSIYMKAKAEDCNTTCSGDVTQVCGAKERINVYSLEEEKLALTYRGCYAGGALALGIKRYDIPVSREGCKNSCDSRNYKYYGMSGGSSKQCFCGNEIIGTKIDEDKCNDLCDSEDSDEGICGGIHNELSIYRGDPENNYYSSSSTEEEISHERANNNSHNIAVDGSAKVEA